MSRTGASERTNLTSQSLKILFSDATIAASSSVSSRSLPIISEKVVSITLVPDRVADFAEFPSLILFALPQTVSFMIRCRIPAERCGQGRRRELHVLLRFLEEGSEGGFGPIRRQLEPAGADTKLVANNGLLHSAVTQQKDRSTGATQSRRIGYCVTLTLRAELRSAREDLLCPFADSLDRGRKADLCLMFLAERGCAVTGPYHCAFSAHANGLLVMSVSIPNLNHCRLYRVHMVRIARPSSSFLLTIVTDRGRSCSRTWFRRA